MRGRSRKPPEAWAVIQECAFLNQALGVTTITPWNIGQIPEHWIQLVIAGKNTEAELAGKS